MTDPAVVRISKVGSVLLAGLLLSACVEGGPGPVPSDEATVAVRLAPGESQTIEFQVEAESFGSDERFYIYVDPSPTYLDGEDVEVAQFWTLDGTVEEGWPETVDIDRGQTINGVLSMTLTNVGQATDFDLTVTIDAGGGGIPEPSVEELRLDIEALPVREALP